MKKIICHTKFALNPFADGGSKRSVQIREILADSGLEYEDDSFKLPKGASKAQLARWAFRAMRFIWRSYPEKIRSLGAYLNLVKYYALRIPIIYDKYEHQDIVFLWEDTTDKKELYLMKATGRPVLGLPHNIESLVSGHSVNALDEEVENLRHCDAVFAISREETWLLRLLGIDAFYLPYYPPKPVQSFLLSIREKRESRELGEKKNFLLLGSASNAPTRVGMQSLIDFADNHSISFQLHVAGYRTQSLRNPNNPNMIFHGTVSNEELERLLVETDAVLIYQPPTTGALTRVPEMLIAGVPVFANFDAARNCHNVEDVHQYASFEELFELLQGFEPYQAKRIEQDEQSVQQFVELLKR